jgi:hypothetical protein
MSAKNAAEKEERSPEKKYQRRYCQILHINLL